MGRYIIKIDDLYFEWSTIVDAPVTYGMLESELVKYIRDQYGLKGLVGLNDRLMRVKKTGTSAHGLTLDELIEFNRAGDNEKSLSKEDLYKKFANR